MIRVIEHSVLHEEQRKLLAEKGGDLQKDFLNAALDRDQFCEWIKKWGFIDGDEPPVPDKKWTEGEFLNPPYGTEEIIAKTWGDLKFREAARPGTWFSIHLKMIEQKKIDSSFLAGAPNGSDNLGVKRIGQAQQSNDPEEVDKRVRDILRRMGGVTQRSARTTYENCPTARAWWRHQYAKEAKGLFSGSEGDIKEFSDTLRKAAGLWAELIASMTSSLTVIGNPSIRSSLIRFRSSLRGQDEDSELSAKQIKNLIQRIGRRAAIQALGALEAQKVLEIIESEIYPQVSGNEAQ